MTALCTKLYQHWDAPEWNDFDLALLSGKELVFLCLMMGIPHSGTKGKKIVRLLSCRIVRQELSRFKLTEAAKDNGFSLAQEVADSFKRERLKWMATQAQVWKSGNKIQLAAVLLRWRDDCRQKGLAYFADCVEVTKQQGIQMELAWK